MPIHVTCSVCKTAFRVKDHHAGKRGKCPRCKARVEVPMLLTPVDMPAGKKKQPPPSAPQHLDMRQILNAFQGDLQPVRRTLAYFLGVLLLTVAMLVLPVLYLALLAAIAFLIYYHATVNLAVIGEMRHWLALFFLYVGPLVVGVILLFFMVKPLFARRARAHKPRILEFGEEPLLFALVTRVAQAVRAPEPKRVQVVCETNASAAFGSMFGVIFGGDLVLTIGLPLAARLTVQQLAGVIAHELGHFTQSGGMRLSYVVRTVNAWFSRVVYERDSWDESLVSGSEKDTRLAIVLQLARLCIFLTRAVLWLLMIIGHALSCFMLRQMEFDADRFEVRLAGTSDFAATSRKLLLLELASTAAHDLAANSWDKTERLPEDLCQLIAAISDRIPPVILRDLETDLKKNSTKLFDTHPSYKERLASARRENAPGIFHLAEPAARLFKNYPKLSRAVTLAFYREVIGRRVKSAVIVPTAHFIAPAESQEESAEPAGA